MFRYTHVASNFLSTEKRLAYSGARARARSLQPAGSSLAPTLDPGYIAPSARSKAFLGSPIPEEKTPSRELWIFSNDSTRRASLILSPDFDYNLHAVNTRLTYRSPEVVRRAAIYDE